MSLGLPFFVFLDHQIWIGKKVDTPHNLWKYMQLAWYPEWETVPSVRSNALHPSKLWAQQCIHKQNHGSQLEAAQQTAKPFANQVYVLYCSGSVHLVTTAVPVAGTISTTKTNKCYFRVSICIFSKHKESRVETWNAFLPPVIGTHQWSVQIYGHEWEIRHLLTPRFVLFVSILCLSSSMKYPLLAKVKGRGNSPLHQSWPQAFEQKLPGTHHLLFLLQANRLRQQKLETYSIDSWSTTNQIKQDFISMRFSGHAVS